MQPIDHQLSCYRDREDDWLNGGLKSAHRSTEASGQAERLVIDCTRSPQSYESICKQAHDGLMRRKDFTDVYVVNREEIMHYSKKRA